MGQDEWATGLAHAFKKDYSARGSAGNGRIWCDSDKLFHIKGNKTRGISPVRKQQKRTGVS